MTDSETRTLRSYLASRKASLQFAKEQYGEHEAARATAARKAEDYNAQHALGMRQWAKGRMCEAEAAIAEFEELLAELGVEEVNVETNIHPHQLP